MLDPALRALLLFTLSSPTGPSAKVEDNPPPHSELGVRTHCYAGARLCRFAGGLDHNGLEFLQLFQERP